MSTSEPHSQPDREPCGSQQPQPLLSGPCLHCGQPTNERCAGDYICLSCYALAGACCSGE